MFGLHLLKYPHVAMLHAPAPAKCWIVSIVSNWRWTSRTMTSCSPVLRLAVLAQQAQAQGRCRRLWAGEPWAVWCDRSWQPLSAGSFFQSWRLWWPCCWELLGWWAAKEGGCNWCCARGVRGCCCVGDLGGISTSALGTNAWDSDVI